MKGLITLLLILFFGWCFGSTYWYVCKIKGLCEDDPQEVVEETPAPVIEDATSGNLLFSKSSAEPESNDATLATMDSVKGLSADTLVITGHYYSDEENGAQLGLDRAANVLIMLKNNGFDKPARLESALAQGNIGTDKYRAVAFAPIVNSGTGSDEGFTFTSTDTKIVINFPVASADPHGDRRLTDQLKSFAEKASSNGTKIKVTGHTDNTGTHDNNIYYGQLRADVITKLLIEYGMNKNNIDAISKGESEPIATNDTEAGRKQNRRVEIETLSK